MFERGNLSRRGFMHRSHRRPRPPPACPCGTPSDVHAADEKAKADGQQPDANGKLNFGWVGIGSPQSRAFQVYGDTSKFKQDQRTWPCATWTAGTWTRRPPG